MIFQKPKNQQESKESDMSSTLEEIKQKITSQLQEERRNKISQSLLLSSNLNSTPKGKSTKSSCYNYRKQALRIVNVSYNIDEIVKFWNEFSCCEKVNLLTFFSSEISENIDTINNSLICIDVLNRKNSNSKTLTQEIASKTNDALDSKICEQAQTSNPSGCEEDEFPLLTSLEIFWKINSDNIDLLKDNWRCTCDKLCDSENISKFDSDFIVYEVKTVIEGDILIRYANNINPSFINGEQKELPLFDTADKMYKYLNSMIRIDQIHSWKDFEKQLTRVIEYKVSVAYFWKEKERIKKKYEEEIEQKQQELLELYSKSEQKSDQKKRKPK